MEDTKEKEDLIPVEEVLDDMYDELGIVSYAARDYYYTHYATREMDMEDKINEIIAKIGIAIIIGLIIFSFISIF